MTTCKPYIYARRDVIDGDRWGVTCPQCRYESNEVTSHAMARVLLQQHQGETV